MGETRHAYKHLVRKPERSGPIGRILRYECGKTILLLMGGKGVDWIRLPQNRGLGQGLVSTKMNIRMS
jgi:hypothetical protein